MEVASIQGCPYRGFHCRCKFDQQYGIPNFSSLSSSPLFTELLVVIKETENDDLTEVMQQLIETYASQIEDVAVSISNHLVSDIILFVENVKVTVKPLILASIIFSDYKRHSSIY